MTKIFLFAIKLCILYSRRDFLIDWISSAKFLGYNFSEKKEQGKNPFMFFLIMKSLIPKYLLYMFLYFLYALKDYSIQSSNQATKTLAKILVSYFLLN